MCGIAGIISLGHSDVSLSEVKEMTDTLIHRGPDGEGQWVSDDGRVGLGHRRLSIIDLSPLGAQPMTYMERYTITYNGEIYNYVEIKANLIAKGYRFKSESDTEVILAAYDAYGAGCLQHFDGMFALVIYDKVSKTVFGARDRLGEKPFYYATYQEKLLFASEMKAIWKVGLTKSISDEGIYHFLISGYASRPNPEHTFYEHVFKLQPSHYFLLNEGDKDIKQIKYWEVSSHKDEDLGLLKHLEEIKEVLVHSVSIRRRSDVAIGSSLSGGLDSSLIVGIMNKLREEKEPAIHTFSATFPGFERDESYYQELINKEVKAESNKITLSTSEGLSLLDKLIYHQEEPFGSMSIVTQGQVYQAARQNGVIVLLDGQGADEVFGGYNYSTLSFLRNLWNSYKVLSLLKSSIQASSNQNMPISYFIGGALSHMIPDSIISSFQRGNPLEAHQMMHKDFRMSFDKGLEPSKGVIFDTLGASLKYQLTKSPLPELLRFSDRNAMSHSVEVRLPYLSHHLIEKVFSIPDCYKIVDGWTKHLLRRVSTSFIPQEITWRKDKVAFEHSDNYLKKEKDTDIIQDLLQDTRIKYIFDMSKKISDDRLFFRKIMVSKMLSIVE